MRELQALLVRSLIERLDDYQRYLKHDVELAAQEAIDGHSTASFGPVFDQASLTRLCLASTKGHLEQTVYTKDFPCPDSLEEAELAALLDLAASPYSFSPVQADSSGVPMMKVARLIGDHLVYGAVSTQFIADLGASLKFGERGHAAIVDQTGRLLAHPKPSWAAEMRDISKLSVVQKILDGESGVTRFTSPALNDDMYSSFAPVDGAGWGVMINMPVSELAARQDWVEYHTYEAVAFAAIIALIFSWIISGYLSKPLRKFIAVSARFAGGDYAARIEDDRQGPIEFQQLATHFNSMAHTTSETYSKLAAIAEGLARSGSRGSLEDIVGELARIAEADVAILSELGPDNSTDTHTKAVFVDGERVPDFAYELSGTPCGDVAQKDVLIIEDGVREAYPSCLPLKRWNVSAYAGVSVSDQSGKTIGMLCMFFRNPIGDADSLLNLMNLTSERISNEWERQELEADLRNAIIALEKASSAKSDFLAHMSHELRTPLNGIIGFGQMLSDPTILNLLPEEKRAEYAKDILFSAHHLLTLINDVLDLSKIEAGQFQLSESIFLLEDAILEAVKMSQPIADKANVKIDVDLGSALLVSADMRLIRQVAINILGNAIKFAPSGSVVRISAEWSRGEPLKIMVSDQGKGMDEDMIKVALQPFGQAHGDVGITRGGTGLGIPISQRFMELHQGSLEIVSERGKGTTIILCLPEDRLALGKDHAIEA